MSPGAQSWVSTDAQVKRGVNADMPGVWGATNGEPVFTEGVLGAETCACARPAPCKSPNVHHGGVGARLNVRQPRLSAVCP